MDKGGHFEHSYLVLFWPLLVTNIYLDHVIAHILVLGHMNLFYKLPFYKNLHRL